MRQIDFDSCRNYYERLVFQQVLADFGESELAAVPGALEDIACLALNQLPARYVRYAIDTAFYLSVDEQQAMLGAVVESVARAAQYVQTNPRGPLSGELPGSGKL